jgi:hypothetical protein
MSERICIVGAGAAGIGSALALLEAGIEFDILEASDRVGGHWNEGYDILHLITSRDSTSFPGYPMPSDYPVFPSRAQVLAYLQQVASASGISEKIRFNQSVERISRSENGRWLVGTADFEGEYSSVMVATGHLRVPRMPELAARFTGTSVHSRHYRNTSNLRGTSVLIVGSGNSGCDIAVDCAQHLLDTDICVRSSQQFIPKSYFGAPLSEQEWYRLPAKERAEASNYYRRVVLGDNEKYPGLPPHDENTPEELDPPVVNSLLLYWIQHGRVKVTPGIVDIQGREVEFTDGTKKSYDSIVWATGYEIKVPGVGDQLSWQGGVPLTYGGSIFPAGPDDELDGLYLIGYCSPRGPQIPVYYREATLVAMALRLRQEGHPVREYVREVSVPSARVDMVRATWDEDMSRVETLLRNKLDEVVVSPQPAYAIQPVK